MVEHFKELGATHAFDYDKADFSGISSTSDSIRLERLYISKIIHKSFVEINEKETEACAFTFVVVNEDLCSEEETRVFNCNRNFIFVIHVDKTYSLTHNNNNSILFFGKCARPN